MPRILTNRRPRDTKLQAVSIEDRGGPDVVVMRFEVGQEAATYSDPTPRTYWLATGHRAMSPETARLIAKRLLEAADKVERSL